VAYSGRRDHERAAGLDWLLVGATFQAEEELRLVYLMYYKNNY
jgi:hypothetical protein